jgi:hypothetical protein
MKTLIIWTTLVLGCQTTPEYYVCKKCPSTNLFILTEDTTDQDALALVRANKTCLKRKKCLTRFYIVQHGQYHAVCGPKKEALCRINPK